jgi:NADH-quinone oxidoreductase subunit B/C/D
MDIPNGLITELLERYGTLVEGVDTEGDIPTITVRKDGIRDVAKFLKTEANPAFEYLIDLTIVHKDPSFTVVYHMYSIGGNMRIRLKVNLDEEENELPTLTNVWRSADWYEREAFDMFGIRFSGHPNMQRILMPKWWKGHPLRKEHPERASEMEDFGYAEALGHEEAPEIDEAPSGGELEILNVNIGPQHPGTHGLLRLVVKLDGEIIREVDPDIGYLHRGIEKIGENRTYHQFIVFTDRLDYLSGALNNLGYVTAVEKLLGLEVPKRAEYIRVILSEIFRICNHLVWIGTFAHDLGALTPAFYTFRDREDAFEIVEMLTGGRMHPSFFRVGGVAKDIPEGFTDKVREFVKSLPAKIKDYEGLLTRNPIFLKRTKGVGAISKEDAVDMGFTGPNIRATGLAFDLRKMMPYSSYDDFEFDIPVEADGDCYARYLIRVEEIRQSLRIIEQANERLPEGLCISEDPHFSKPARLAKGFTVPEGETYHSVESSKGEIGFYIVSMGEKTPFRLRIRTPSFPHVQAISHMAKGCMLADLIAILGSLDYVLADVDR